MANATVADARRAVHESLVGPPAWAADEARAKIEALEAAIRTAAFREAAQVAGDMTHLPGGATYQAGYLDAREEVARDLRRLAVAAAPTTTTED